MATDNADVGQRVARWAVEFIHPEAYVIDDSGFPKDGSDSPGVARMYSPNVGEGGQLSDQSQRAHRDRLGVRCDQLAVVPAALLG